MQRRTSSIPPSAGPSPPVEPPHTPVVFPQQASHCATYYNRVGELCTALLTHGDRLLLLKDGVLIAQSAPLRDLCTKQTSLSSSSWNVFGVAMCSFVDYVIRVAVATTHGIVLVEYDDSGELWSGSREECAWLTNGGPLVEEVSRPLSTLRKRSAVAHAGTWGGNHWRWRLLSLSVGVYQPLTTTTTSSSSSRFSTLSASPSGMEKEKKDVGSHVHGVVVALEFASADTLCVLFSDEAVLVELGWRQGPTAAAATTSSSSASRKSVNPGVLDAVVWRSPGSYTGLAVCPTNHHVALSLGPHRVIVFVSKVMDCHTDTTSAVSRGRDRAGPLSSPFSAVYEGRAGIETPVFSPTMRPASSPTGWPTAAGSPSAPAQATYYNGAPPCEYSLAERGLSLSLGGNTIKRLEWHRVATHTLLCVTARHPRDGTENMLLYTAQYVPTARRYTNVMEQNADGGWGLCHEWAGGDALIDRNCFAQLAPAGVVPLTYAKPAPRITSLASVSSMADVSMLAGSTAAQTAAAAEAGRAGEGPAVVEMFTRLVPNLYGEMGDAVNTRVDFLHLEKNGTVRSSSYALGRQKYASFMKQRAVGLSCARLLEPLLRLYGSLQRMEPLPAWRPRTVELGNDTSKQAAPAEVLLQAARRHRLVLHFSSGMVAVVMVDLTAAVFSVESFLCVGRGVVQAMHHVPRSSASHGVPLLVCLHGMKGLEEESEALQNKIPPQLLSVIQLEDDTHGTRVLTVLPISAQQLKEVLALPTSAQEPTSISAARELETKKNGPVEGPLDRVHAYVAARCPEKAKFIPALLQACQGDAAKLLSQLELKYGPATPPAAESATSDLLTSTVLAPPVQHDESDTKSEEWTWTVEEACFTRQGRVAVVMSATTSSVTRKVMVYADPSLPECFAPVHEMVVGAAPLLPFLPVRRDGTAPSCENGVCCVVLDAPQEEKMNELLSVENAREPVVTAEEDALRAVALQKKAKQELALVQCRLESPSLITISSPLLPAMMELRVEQLPGHNAVPPVVSIKGEALVNNDCVVGLLTALEGGRRQLSVYARVAVQSVMVEAETDTEETNEKNSFRLEATFDRVLDFYWSRSGELLLVREDEERETGTACSSVERWLRCFPKSSLSAPNSNNNNNANVTATSVQVSSATRYSYTRVPHGDIGCPSLRLSANEDDGPVTAVALGPPLANFASLGEAENHTVLFFASPAAQFIAAIRVALRLAPPSLPQQANNHNNHNYVENILRANTHEIKKESTPQYHPDAVMQLIGMAHWSALAAVLTKVAEAATQVLRPPSMHPSTVAAAGTAQELTRLLCASGVAKGLRDRPQLLPNGEAHLHVTPTPVSLRHIQEEKGMQLAGSATTTTTRLRDVGTTLGALLQSLAAMLPQVILDGVTRHEQLELLCIVEALREACAQSQGVDEAAGRYLFFTKFTALRRRLRLPEVTTASSSSTNPKDEATTRALALPIHSIFVFEVGRTATRTVHTASYLWAAMSDSQGTLLSLVLGGSATNTGDGQGIPSLVKWEDVAQVGIPYWLRSPAELRSLAERVGKQQYKVAENLTECALMLCVARKVGTLAALAKAQNNMKLHAFFTRDFNGDEHHREAASANAFAAVSKNMPLYGAAFFLLAGDVRSAVQVILQRCKDAALALFVLRAVTGDGDGASAWVPASSDPTESPLDWYVQQRRAEEASCGSMDMWELACLSWLTLPTAQCSAEAVVERKIAALRRVAAHPTAHPEALCALRYARDSATSLAYRGDRFLSTPKEVACLIRLGRYCLARQLEMNGYLHLRDAAALVAQLRAEAESQNTRIHNDAKGAGGGAGLRAQRAKMSADYNTGTLNFRGFDSDEDDEGGPNGQHTADAIVRTQEEAVTVAGSPDPPKEALSARKCEELLHEIKYAYVCIGADKSNMGANLHEWNQEEKDKNIFDLLASLEVHTVRTAASSRAGTVRGQDRQQGYVQRVHDLLEVLFATLHDDLQTIHAKRLDHSVEEKNEFEEDGDDESVLNNAEERCGTLPSRHFGGAESVVLCALVTVLGVLAARTANYMLLRVLLRMPLSLDLLRRTAQMQGLVQINQPTGEAEVQPLSSSLSLFFALLVVRLRVCHKTALRKVTAAAEAAAEVANAFTAPWATEEYHEREDNSSSSGWTSSASPTRQRPSRHESGHSSPTPRDAGSSLQKRTSTFFTVPSSMTSRRGVAAQDTEEMTGEELGFSLMPAEQSALLLSCSVALLEWRVLRALLRQTAPVPPLTPTSQAATDAGLLYGPPHGAALPMIRPMVQKSLLTGMLCFLTVQCGRHSEEVITRLDEVLRRGKGRDVRRLSEAMHTPNGMILEVEASLKKSMILMMGLVDASVKPSSPDSLIKGEEEAEDTSWSSRTRQREGTEGETAQLMMEVCCGEAELLWRLPSLALTQCGTARVTGACFSYAMQIATADHVVAASLVQDLLSVSSEGYTRRSGMPSASTTAPGSPVMRLPPPAASLDSTEFFLSSAPQTNRTCKALALLQLLALRRHHTHASLRALLLSVALEGDVNLASMATDRLILTQEHHSILSVEYDHSSCDSVVWSTEAGTHTSHGFRELLAGDNQEVLQAQITERNAATANFTKGLEAQRARIELAAQYSAVHAAGTSEAKRGSPPPPLDVRTAMAVKSALERRPVCGVAVHSLPASHPHLPFFLTRQRDGHLDLYSFASQECIATYSVQKETAASLGSPGGGGLSLDACQWNGSFGHRHETYATTTTQYSPSGYLAVAGLADGAVAVWRFTAAAVEGGPSLLTPKLFIPYGIRACFFCEERTSTVAAVGLVAEPHHHVVSQAVRGVRGTPGATGLVVGEVLLFDILQGKMTITARCALPFIPEFALSLSGTSLLLVVSADGFAAVYDVEHGALTIIQSRSLQDTLHGAPWWAANQAGASNDATNTGLQYRNRPAVAVPSDAAVALTALTYSPHDEVAILGTSHGFALLLHLQTILDAVQQSKADVYSYGEDEEYLFYPILSVPSSSSSPSGAAASSRGTGGLWEDKKSQKPSFTSPTSATSPSSNNTNSFPHPGLETLAAMHPRTVLSRATCVQVAPQRGPRSAVTHACVSPSMMLAGLLDGKVIAASLVPQAVRQALVGRADETI